MTAKPESQLQNEIMLGVTQAGARVWRNNVGALQDKTGQWVRYGVCNPGGGDLLGYTPVRITAEDIGKTLAVFTSIEVKTATGTVTQPQKNFHDVVRAAGGIAIIARSVEQAVEGLKCP